MQKILKSSEVKNPSTQKFEASWWLEILMFPVIAVGRTLFYLLVQSARRIKSNEHLFPYRRTGESPAIYVYWNSKSLYLIPDLSGARIKYFTFYDLKHWVIQKIAGMPDSQRLVFISKERAFFQLVRALKTGESVCLAVDGPYDEPGKLKEGAAAVSWRTQYPLIATQVEVDRSFRLSWRWDKFEIGWPFAKVKITPTYHDPKTAESFESYCCNIEKALGNP